MTIDRRGYGRKRIKTGHLVKVKLPSNQPPLDALIENWSSVGLQILLSHKLKEDDLISVGFGGNFVAFKVIWVKKHSLHSKVSSCAIKLIDKNIDIIDLLKADRFEFREANPTVTANNTFMPPPTGSAKAT